MNTTVLRYIVAAAEEKSITRAAERLYISQPSLSQSISQLERQLGVTLFERSRKGLEITPAGEQYVNWARQTLFSEVQINRRIKDIAQYHITQLAFGTTPNRATYIIEPIIQELKGSFANCKIILEDRPTTELYQLLETGRIDFIVDVPSEDTLNFHNIPLAQEKILVAVPKSFDIPHVEACAEDYPSVSLSLFKDVPFTLMSEETALGKYSRMLCKKAGFFPDIRLQCRRQATAHMLCSKNFSATFLNELMVRLGGGYPNVNYYCISPDFPVINLAAVYHTDRMISDTAQLFIRRIREYLVQHSAPSNQDIMVMKTFKPSHML